MLPALQVIDISREREEIANIADLRNMFRPHTNVGACTIGVVAIPDVR